MKQGSVDRNTPFGGLPIFWELREDETKIPRRKQNRVSTCIIYQEAAMKKGMKKKEEAFREEPTAPIVDDRAIHQVIAKKAYELYEKGGRRHGHDLEDWLEAEQWVLSESKGEKKLISIPRTK
jgi:hypothetical protein